MSRKEPNGPPPPGAVKPPAPPPPPLPRTHEHEFVSDQRVGDDPNVHRRVCRICGAQQTIYVDSAPNDDRLDAFAAGLKERLRINKKRYVTDTTDYTYGGGSENVLDFDDLITEIDAFTAEFKGKR